MSNTRTQALEAVLDQANLQIIEQKETMRQVLSWLEQVDNKHTEWHVALTPKRISQSVKLLKEVLGE